MSSSNVWVSQACWPANIYSMELRIKVPTNITLWT